MKGIIVLAVIGGFILYNIPQKPEREIKLRPGAAILATSAVTIPIASLTSAFIRAHKIRDEPYVYIH